MVRVRHGGQPSTVVGTTLDRVLDVTYVCNFRNGGLKSPVFPSRVHCLSLNRSPRLSACVDFATAASSPLSFPQPLSVLVCMCEFCNGSLKSTVFPSTALRSCQHRNK